MLLIYLKLNPRRLFVGARNPERETPILSLCHGVFTEKFIFRHILR